MYSFIKPCMRINFYKTNAKDKGPIGYLNPRQLGWKSTLRSTLTISDSDTRGITK